MGVGCAAWQQDLSMLVEQWATGGDGIADGKVDYLLKVLIPFVIKHVADKPDVWKNLPKCGCPLWCGFT